MHKYYIDMNAVIERIEAVDDVVENFLLVGPDGVPLTKGNFTSLLNDPQMQKAGYAYLLVAMLVGDGSENALWTRVWHNEVDSGSRRYVVETAEYQESAWRLVKMRLGINDKGEDSSKGKVAKFRGVVE